MGIKPPLDLGNRVCCRPVPGHRLTLNVSVRFVLVKGNE